MDHTVTDDHTVVVLSVPVKSIFENSWKQSIGDDSSHRTKVVAEILRVKNAATVSASSLANDVIADSLWVPGRDHSIDQKKVDCIHCCRAVKVNETNVGRDLLVNTVVHCLHSALYNLSPIGNSRLVGRCQIVVDHSSLCIVRRSCDIVP